MVSGSQHIPDELLPPSEHKDDVLRFLAFAHGDREDSKRTLLILADEDDDLDLTGDDIRTVTQDDPIDTFN